MNKEGPGSTYSQEQIIKILQSLKISNEFCNEVNAAFNAARHVAFQEGYNFYKENMLKKFKKSS